MTVLDRMRAADPAADYAPAVDEQLLRSVLAEPRTAPRRRVPGRRLVAATAIAAAAIATVAVVGDKAPSLDLTARAYAQTSAAEAILYARTHTETTMTSPRGVDRSTIAAEYWNYGDRARYRTTGQDADHPPTTFEMTVADDGTLRARQTEGPAPDADWRTITAGEALAHLRRSFVGEFRLRYERGQLDPDGDAAFAGHTARRYIVDDGTVHSEYYVDPETAEPLGVVHVARYAIEPDGPLVGTQRTVTTVEELSHLDATSENLEKLAG